MLSVYTTVVFNGQNQIADIVPLSALCHMIVLLQRLSNNHMCLLDFLKESEVIHFLMSSGRFIP